MKIKGEYRTSVVLSGGKSRRFGQNKALYPFNDKALIENVIEVLKDVSDEIIIVSNEKDLYGHLGYKIIEDFSEFKGMGPLAGLYSALNHIKSPRLFLVACDMPFIDRDLIDYLWGIDGGYQAIVPFYGCKYQPLHAIYHKSIRDIIYKRLLNSQRDMRGVLEEIDVCVVSEEKIRDICGDKNPFFNINTKDDLLEAKRALG